MKREEECPCVLISETLLRESLRYSRLPTGKGRSWFSASRSCLSALITSSGSTASSRAISSPYTLLLETCEQSKIGFKGQLSYILQGLWCGSRISKWMRPEVALS